MYSISEQHLLLPAEFHPSEHFNTRPADENGDISLLVVHCISLPEGIFNTPHIDDLFLGKLDIDAHPSFSSLEGVRVSAHIVIYRDGRVVQYVPFDKRAWHAGVSEYNGRQGCNDFSIGIELEGTDKTAYTDVQYNQLIAIANCLVRHYPKLTQSRITGHEDIAPGRKTDPGTEFDWQRLMAGIE